MDDGVKGVRVRMPKSSWCFRHCGSWRLRRFWPISLILMLASHYALAQGLVQEITQPDGSLHHQFGFSVAVDGNTMVTGDPDYIWQGHPCIDERGAIAVYNNVGGAWQRSQQFLYIGDGTARTRLGWSVAIRGNVIVAATPGQNYVSGATTIADAGALSVYRRSSATAPFAFSGQAFAPTPAANAEFTSTWPVATNGTYAAATAGSANPNVVYVYSVSGSTPTYLTTITMPVPIVTSLFITDQNGARRELYIRTRANCVRAQRNASRRDRHHPPWRRIVRPGFSASRKRQYHLVRPRQQCQRIARSRDRKIDGKFRPVCAHPAHPCGAPDLYIVPPYDEGEPGTLHLTTAPSRATNIPAGHTRSRPSRRRLPATSARIQWPSMASTCS